MAWKPAVALSALVAGHAVNAEQASLVDSSIDNGRRLQAHTKWPHSGSRSTGHRPSPLQHQFSKVITSRRPHSRRWKKHGHDESESDSEYGKEELGSEKGNSGTESTGNGDDGDMDDLDEFNEEDDSAAAMSPPGYGGGLDRPSHRFTTHLLKKHFSGDSDGPHAKWGLRHGDGADQGISPDGRGGGRSGGVGRGRGRGDGGGGHGRGGRGRGDDGPGGHGGRGGGGGGRGTGGGGGRGGRGRGRGDGDDGGRGGRGGGRGRGGGGGEDGDDGSGKYYENPVHGHKTLFLKQFFSEKSHKAVGVDRSQLGTQEPPRGHHGSPKGHHVSVFAGGSSRSSHDKGSLHKSFIHKRIFYKGPHQPWRAEAKTHHDEDEDVTVEYGSGYDAAKDGTVQTGYAAVEDEDIGDDIGGGEFIEVIEIPKTSYGDAAGEETEISIGVDDEMVDVIVYPDTVIEDDAGVQDGLHMEPEHPATATYSAEY